MEKVSFMLAGLLLFGGIAAISLLATLYIGWWFIAISSVLGIFVGNAHHKTKLKEQTDEMLASLGVSKH